MGFNVLTRTRNLPGTQADSSAELRRKDGCWADGASTRIHEKLMIILMKLERVGQHRYREPRGVCAVPQRGKTRGPRRESIFMNGKQHTRPQACRFTPGVKTAHCALATLDSRDSPRNPIRPRTSR